MGDLVLDGDRVVAAAGYLAWPGGIARLSVLTDPGVPRPRSGQAGRIGGRAGCAGLRENFSHSRRLSVLSEKSLAVVPLWRTGKGGCCPGDGGTR